MATRYCRSNGKLRRLREITRWALDVARFIEVVVRVIGLADGR